MIERIQDRPYLFIVVLANIGAVSSIIYCLRHAKFGWAFLSSCLNVGLLMVLFAIGTFPDVIRSSINPRENSLNVINSAASPMTLTVLAIIVAMGIPLVIAYFFYIYRVFKGKVQLDHMSY